VNHINAHKDSYLFGKGSGGIYIENGMIDEHHIYQDCLPGSWHIMMQIRHPVIIGPCVLDRKGVSGKPRFWFHVFHHLVEG
jgi:hypothetical protein